MCENSTASQEEKLFDTSFERQSDAIETVSMTLDEGGQWRAAGYFIKPASQ